MRVPLLYKDKPVFGFDIGSRTVKVVQIKRSGRKTRISGYGYADFPADIILEGIISDPKAMAEIVSKLLAKPLQGKITADRAIVSLPASKLFIRILQLPPMSPEDLDQAVRFETEQYVPIPLSDLYLDYEVIASEGDQKEKHQDILMVAAPKAIVDSYIKLFDYLGLEIGLLETSMGSITRAMISANRPNSTTLVIDMGSIAADFTIYNKVIRLTGTVGVGGDHFTETLAKKLGITPDQANEIKYKFGIAESGLKTKVLEALTPQLQTVAAEAKKVIKFYEERSEGKDKVQNIILAGGSASMPGLLDFLYQQIGVPTQIGDPWSGLVTDPLKAVPKINAPMYTTAIGLALLEVQRD